MSTTETDVAPGSSTTPADLTKCPACGSHVLFTVELDYGATAGYRPDHFGVEPVQGDTITRCDDCAAFFVHVDGDRVATPAAATTPDETSPTDPGDAATLDAIVSKIDSALADKVTELEAALAEKVAELEAQLAAAHQPATPDQPAAPATDDTSAAAPSDTSTPGTPDTTTPSASDASPPSTPDTAAVPDPPTPTT